MSYALIILLISPFLILFINFPKFQIYGIEELIYVFKFTTVQAVLSAFISVAIGFIASLSMLNMTEKHFKFIEIFCLLPCFIPTLFVVFSFLNLSVIFNFDIKGLVGIVSIHSIMNIGICAVMLTKILKNKLAMSNRLFSVQSSGVLNYLYKIILPLSFGELIYLFSSIFLFCFTSFSIPLIIGGVKSTTVDLLIYEKIISGNLNQAISIALLQFFFIGFFLLVINLSAKKDNYTMIANWQSPFKFRYSYLLALAPVIVIGLGLVLGFPFSSLMKTLKNISLEIILFSFLLALIAGYTMFLFVQILLSQLPNTQLSRFMSFYSSPSTALVCLSFIILSSDLQFLKMIIFLVFIILFTPFLFKLFLHNFISKITSSIKLSRVYGANFIETYKMIILPMSYQVTLFVSFVTAAWVMGDYAISSILLKNDITIALKIKSFMRSYQLEEAYGLIAILVCCEVVLYLIYKGLSGFAYKKY